MSDDEETPLPGPLQKAKSLPKLDVIYENIGDHPGHRYLTPQPTKRKPFISPKPTLNGTANRPSIRGNTLHEDIAEHESDDSSDSDSDNPADKSQSPVVKKGTGRGKASKNERLEEAKRDLVASCGPLTPKRVAPVPPGGPRRKAPSAPSNKKKKPRRKSDTEAQEARRVRRPIRTSRDVLSRSNAIDQPDSPDGLKTKEKIYYTPQPKRKTFNIPRNNSFNAFDEPRGSKSPVERLANMAKLNMASSKGSSGSSSSDSTSSPGFSPQFSVSSPSPSPRSVTSPKSLSPSSSQHSSISSTPSTTSPKSYPISPLAIPSQGVNITKSPLSGMVWQTRPQSEDYSTSTSRSSSKRPNLRTRPQSSPDGPVCQRIPKKGLRKTSGSGGVSRNSSKNRRISRTKSTGYAISSLRSPDRSMQPAQAFESALKSANVDPKTIRREKSVRDELLRMSVTTSQTNRTNNNMEPNGIAAANNRFSRQNSQNTNMTEIDSGPSFQRLHSEPPTPGSSGIPTSPSSGFLSAGSTPSPTSSSKNRPSLFRHISSVSMSKSLFGSREVLNDLFRSERGTNKSLKATAGFITGLILGVVLFVGLYYGLDYSLYVAIGITAVSTLLMALALAFTVRARCVAVLMLPTLCTQRGRAAFLAIVVALLLNGPVNNIFINANEVSTSMSCSAELAYNQSQMIKEVAAQVFDQYVKNLEQSVEKLEGLAQGVRGVFKPVEDGLDAVQNGLNTASDVLSEAGRRCRQVIQGAYLDCTLSLNQAYKDCKRELTRTATLRGSNIEAICEVVNIGGACKLLRVERLCEAPNIVDNWVENAAESTVRALQNLRLAFDTDVDFTLYWQERLNTSRSFQAVQEAVQEELNEKIAYLDWGFSLANKLLALSVLWLCFQSHQYHMKYRTKDKFDNFYITQKFKKLDAKRKEQGRPSVLPLKKTEKVRLIDLTSVSLSKPEKGMFKIGFVTVIMHSVIAGLLVLIDYGLFELLALINRHGQLKSEVSAEHSSEINVKGNGALANFIRETFISSFEAASSFNSSIDANLCLPKPTHPNEYLSIVIGSFYLLAILTVLFQAYAMRLRRKIAAYYYPERELERLYYLYHYTLQHRQSLSNFLQLKVKQTQHELEASQKVSFISYMAIRYPRSQKFFRFFGMEKKICLGCANEDDNKTFKECASHKCPGRYCYECFQEMAGICSLCEGIIEEAKDPEFLPVVNEVEKPPIKDVERSDLKLNTGAWHYKDPMNEGDNMNHDYPAPAYEPTDQNLQMSDVEKQPINDVERNDLTSFTGAWNDKDAPMTEEEKQTTDYPSAPAYEPADQNLKMSDVEKQPINDVERKDLTLNTAWNDKDAPMAEEHKPTTDVPSAPPYDHTDQNYHQYFVE